MTGKIDPYFARFGGNVLDFGAKGDGTTDDTAAFTAAAAAHSVVYVPPGAYALASPVTGSTRWIIAKGTTFPTQGTVGTLGLPNTSYLGGRVFQFWDNGTWGGLVVGDPDAWSEGYRAYSASIAELAVTSPKGQIAISGMSRSSDRPTVNQGTIGGEFIAVNDDTANVKPVFGVYIESWRTADSVGAAFAEIESINKGSFHDLNPNTVRSLNSKDSMCFVFAAGGGDVAGVSTSSAATAAWNNGAYFWRGHVIMAGALDPTGPKEAFAMPSDCRTAWHAPNGVGLVAWDQADTQQRTSLADADNSGFTSAIKRRKGNNTSATDNLDRIYRQDYYGFTGSSDYVGAYIQVLQRTDFSGGNARFSIDVTANAADGTACQMSLNGLADKSYAPFPANTISLGTAAQDFTEVHARRHYYSATVFDAFGTGTPEGNLIGSPGCTFRRTDGGAGTCFYVKESGTGNTGWVAK